MIVERCEICKFWRQSDYACRRFPPNQAAIVTYAKFPLTAPHNWCGEFKSTEIPEE